MCGFCDMRAVRGGLKLIAGWGLVNAGWVRQSCFPSLGPGPIVMVGPGGSVCAVWPDWKGQRTLLISTTD